MKPNWDAISAIGQWIGSISTTGAVVLSLWLTIKRPEKIQVFGGILVTLPNVNKYITLMASNNGQIAVEVNSFVIRTGLFHKHYGIMSFQFTCGGSSQLPKKINYGEKVFYYYTLDGFKQILTSDLFKPKKLDKWLPNWLFVRTMKLQVNNPGKPFKNKLHHSLREFIYQYHKDSKKN